MITLDAAREYRDVATASIERIDNKYVGNTGKRHVLDVLVRERDSKIQRIAEALIELLERNP